MKNSGKPKGSMKQMPKGEHKMPGGYMMPDAEMGKMVGGKQSVKKGKK